MEPSRNEIEEATANFRLEQIRRKIDKQSIKQRQLERNSNTQKLVNYIFHIISANILIDPYLITILQNKHIVYIGGGLWPIMSYNDI